LCQCWNQTAKGKISGEPRFVLSEQGIGEEEQIRDCLMMRKQKASLELIEENLGWLSKIVWCLKKFVSEVQAMAAAEVKLKSPFALFKECDSNPSLTKFDKEGKGRFSDGMT
jgi:hypothetical protein